MRAVQISEEARKLAHDEDYLFILTIAHVWELWDRSNDKIDPALLCESVPKSIDSQPEHVHNRLKTLLGDNGAEAVKRELEKAVEQELIFYSGDGFLHPQTRKIRALLDELNAAEIAGNVGHGVLHYLRTREQSNHHL